MFQILGGYGRTFTIAMQNSGITDWHPIWKPISLQGDTLPISKSKPICFIWCFRTTKRGAERQRNWPCPDSPSAVSFSSEEETGKRLHAEWPLLTCDHRFAQVIHKRTFSFETFLLLPRVSRASTCEFLIQFEVECKSFCVRSEVLLLSDMFSIRCKDLLKLYQRGKKLSSKFLERSAF